MSDVTDAMIAVDIGNMRAKFGLFEGPAGEGLPAPVRTMEISFHERDLDELLPWLNPYSPAQVTWWIGSVNRPGTFRLLDWLASQGAAETPRLLAHTDVPLQVSLPKPELVGIDRLLNAVAANRLRALGEAAIVVDLGSAITVDRVSRDGSFAGGAILPGIGMAARALHEFTDLLPLLDVREFHEAPAGLGTSTVEALESGLFWGAVGGIRELVGQLSSIEDRRPPTIFLTGGGAATIAEHLSLNAKHIPHLTLSGIAVAAQAARG
jgi:type III pantothenate kinase